VTTLFGIILLASTSLRIAIILLCLPTSLSSSTLVVVAKVQYLLLLPLGAIPGYNGFYKMDADRIVLAGGHILED
jgi:hypothetical protein